ncbi:MAG: hypothetical protein LC737_10600, partial [Chloroflexi bacterium]|nr:hypothetical protein [Chloroflexota bacterium]
REPPRYVGEYAYPSWSPDSSALTYTVKDSVFVRALNRWDEARRIAQLPSRAVGYAEWSPAGDWIAFLAFEQATAVPSGAKQQLWLVRPDGAQLHMLESIDALGRGRGSREVQWGDRGRIVFAADSSPWILEPSRARKFTFPFALPYEPPRIEMLSPLQPVGMGKSEGRTYAIRFNAYPNGWPSVTELRECGIFVAGWSSDGTRLLCTPGMVDRMSIDIFDGRNDFANWGHVFDLPGPEVIFFTPNDDELVFETRLEGESEPVIWRFPIDPLAKPVRISAGMLFGVFRIK